MHLIARGFGLLVAIVGFLGLLLASFVTTTFTQDSTYYQTHVVPKLCGSLLCAVLMHGAVRMIEKFRPSRVIVDKSAGQELTQHRDDSFFFIPIRFLPHAALIFGAYIAFSPFIFDKSK